MHYKENIHRIPSHMHDAVERYVQKGIPPGGFLEAVLANDLQGAFSRADLENRRAMFDWVQYVYNDLPSGCHGSNERVAYWIKEGGFEGICKDV